MCVGRRPQDPHNNPPEILEWLEERADEAAHFAAICAAERRMGA